MAAKGLIVMKEKKQRGQIPSGLKRWPLDFIIVSVCVLASLLPHAFPSISMLLSSLLSQFDEAEFRTISYLSLFFFISVPEDHLLWSNRSHAYASEDKYKEAYHDAEMVLKLRPDWPKVCSECLYMYALNLFLFNCHTYLCM